MLPSFSKTPEKSFGPFFGGAEKSMIIALSDTITAGNTYSLGSPLPPPPITDIEKAFANKMTSYDETKVEYSEDEQTNLLQVDNHQR